MITLVGAVMSGLIAVSEPAATCAPVDKMVEQLRQQYQEQPIWLGRQTDTGSNWVLFANEKTQTWTMVITDKITMCLIGSGQGNVLIKPRNLI